MARSPSPAPQRTSASAIAAPAPAASTTPPRVRRNSRLRTVLRHGLPVIGVVIVVACSVVVMNIIVDLLYAWLDPRIRITAAAR